jgi:hypothetical protein
MPTTEKLSADAGRGGKLLHEEPGERGSDDVRGHATKEGVTLEMIGGDGEAWCELLPEAALRLGEWLIAQAIAQGAGREDREAEARAKNIAYLQANIAQMERFMARGKDDDPIGHMQWSSRRDEFQRDLDEALSREKAG